MGAKIRVKKLIKSKRAWQIHTFCTPENKHVLDLCKNLVVPAKFNLHVSNKFYTRENISQHNLILVK